MFPAKTLLAVAALASATPALSATTVYTSRAAFDAATGGNTIATFNGYAADTSFQSTPLDVGDFTLSIAGPGLSGRNKVDILPIDFAEFNIDGSAVLNIFTDNSTALTFTFDAPIMAFGADLAGFQTNSPGQSYIVAAGSEFVPGSLSPQFFGFTSTVAFTTVTFAGRDFAGGGDGFGIDNVAYASGAVVPEPTTWAMMILGVGAAGGSLRRRTRVLARA